MVLIENGDTVKTYASLQFDLEILSMSEWLLFNVKWAIFRLYHGKNSYIQWDDINDVHFVLNQHA
jgi:hypothetical protein